MQVRRCGAPGARMILMTATLALTITAVGVRRLVQAAAILVSLITGFERIHTGAHWPLEVLGGVLWRVTGLVLLMTVAWRVRPPDGLASIKGRGLSKSSGSVSTVPQKVTMQPADRDRKRSNGRVRS